MSTICSGIRRRAIFAIAFLGLVIGFARPASAGGEFGSPPIITAVSPSSGPDTGGATVTITGLNFTVGATVNFGAVPGTNVVVVGGTTLTVTSPAGIGTVDIRVTTPGGSGGTSGIVAGDRYTYVPAPTVTAVSPATGIISGGLPVTLTGTNLTGTTAISFSGSPATTFTVNSATSITVTSPVRAVAGTVNVRVTTPGGTSATAVGNQFIYTAVPTVTGLSPATGTGAGGTLVTVTGTLFSYVSPGIASSVSAVNFGGVPGTSVTVLSDTSLTVVAPPGTGTVNVTVTTFGGTSATSVVGQFVYAAVVPTMGEWFIGLLALLLGGIGFLSLRGRQSDQTART